MIRDEGDLVPDKTGVFSDSEVGQPRDAELVEACPTSDEQEKKGTRKALSVRCCKALSRSRMLDWLAKSALVSASTRRSFGDTSLRRYAKGKVQAMLNKTPSWALHYGKKSIEKMPAVIRGAQSPLTA